MDHAISLVPQNASAQIVALFDEKALVLDMMGRKNDARAMRQQAQRARSGQ